ncbi:MAG TPA: UvrD-helicase domain-containing protein [Verrucomicrobiae bacterium]|jgi:DNA helicase-2/ATP-dependent DNA helicase PcrA|nr:UvrD-helicase domain-containing protein [Verrucomicrobiae bacterium]
MSRKYVLHEFKTEFHPQIDYASELNPQQLAAVTTPPGPALVIAGAGSGKTRTLTYRVAYLLEQGIPAERILLLTFTNKAAGEMMRRVADLLGTQLVALWGGTFHSIGARVLRVHAETLGYRPDFTILDRDDARDLIKACVADAGIETKGTHFPKPEVLNEVYSLAVNMQKDPREILERQFSYFAEFVDKIADVGRRYADRKRASNAMDFDDLLALWLKLLQENHDALEMYQRRFQFILVDEYQDTNKLQGDLIDLLAARNHNVMAVGDDAQSIYAWRGANFLNILDFPKRYPGAKVFKIETNYRSTPEILNLANAAIAANAHQFPKNLAPSRKSGVKPALVACMDTAQQSAFIAQRIMELHEEGTSLPQIAVLYRSHFHALELQLELTRRQIPFSITSGIRFFEQAHVKDATTYLKLVTNPHDEIAFKRVAQLHPGIGAKGADKLWKIFLAEIDQFQQKAQALPKDVENNRKSPSKGVGKNPIATAVETCAPHVSKKAAVAWAQLVATVAQLEEEPSPSKMLRIVIDAGYDDYLKENFANYQVRLEDLEQLAVFAHSFQTTGEFLTQLALLTNVEAEADDAKGNDERIRLSTIHQAKGLEFEAVFVIMLCDGLFPSARSTESADGTEEERRLFYVAITRAKNELYLVYPMIRAGFGNTPTEYMQEPSRFLAEIPGDLLNKWNLRPAY